MTKPQEPKSFELKSSTLIAATKLLADEGKIVEAGWLGFKHLALRPDTPATQLATMRVAFFSGALHVFSCIMTFLDPDKDPTEADLARMGKLEKELQTFYTAFKHRYGVEDPK